MFTNSSQLERALWKSVKQNQVEKLRDHLHAYKNGKAIQSDSNCIPLMDLFRSVREMFVSVPQLLNRHHERRKMTLLMYACKLRDSEAVRVLIEFGADVNLVDGFLQGNTAMHYAADADDIACVDLLCKANGNIFALNRDGHSPIDVARLHRREAVSQYLTLKLCLHSGWMYVKSRRLHSIWRKRWCMAMACDPSQREFEMAFYRSPKDPSPVAISIVRERRHSVTYCYSSVAVPKSIFDEHGNLSRRAAFMNTLANSLMDKQFMFQAMYPVEIQPVNSEFSRHKYRPLSLLELIFAATSSEERKVWMRLWDPEWCDGTSASPSAPELECEQSSGEEASKPISNPPTPTCNRSRKECVICMTAKKTAACIPCGHIAACMECLDTMVMSSRPECPICRSIITATMNVYEC
uniref:Uncharacterized protein AlNc14C78G5171 n=1 Tax=Albugo laibachii Nc14 TaxID=890382 RepID=F0WEX3_9STRA|nr:conserved hypothetical protein [Albugo laibachii Nc14]|eukprot:CCA19755.1 conserved hypothetical protein [Albugo laibachii Nc14]